MERKIFGRTLLVAGGEVDIYFAKEYVETEHFDTIIGVDAGLDAIKKMGIQADFVMGDFDSVSPAIILEYAELRQHQGTRFLQYPTKKDATDLHLALYMAASKKPEEIVILGATGRRMDHFMANIHILSRVLQFGVPVSILDQYNRIYLLEGKREFKRKEMYGPYISFLPFFERAKGVTLKGFLYELFDAELVKGDSIGVSNEFPEKGELATAEVKEGVLIVVESKDE
ncbi:MAG: thiamine diphosphokinase [Lachnospiraceae bacterium]|nr:thiamine diphosphokinase [Lachnospiraceae bacterium]